ncbi:MAG: bifunctional phosphopantothenoylcysteine decarboxylase/phosphopantothenate--cysteine ligase CoaBC [Candidatus Berkiellales bacterium]
MNATQWLLGVTGGIAAYKTPELVRLLKKQGSEVRVVLSAGAKEFVTSTTLQAVSGNPVYAELFDADFEAAMGHIELARWAQSILIAPLSANRLAALAMGMADDLLTTLCLATQAPIFVAPAMNQAMWHHPATQHNLEIIKARGVTILGPDWGEQACLEVGLGRMLEPQEIIKQLFQTQVQTQNQPATTSALSGLKLLITAGPTREALDPVRYLSNRSSGKMGFALAQMAKAQGATVTLISGPVNLATPGGVQRIDVESAEQMYQAVISNYSQADIFISAAAVADFRPNQLSAQKIKKNAKETWQLSLVTNPDILATVASQPNKPFCVGFAAETENLPESAQQKLRDKKCDLIAVNDVSRSDIGFDVDMNALTVFSQDHTYAIPKMTKLEAASQLLTMIGECYANRIKNS